MAIKKILLASVIIGGLYVARKFSTNIGALNQLTAKIKAIKNLNIADGFINLKIDLNLTNLSDYNIGIDTLNLLSIRKLKFYNAKNRLLIGEANVNISNITLPSKETLVLADIIAKIPTNNLLNHLSLFSTNAGENIKVVPVFNAAGKDFEINPEQFV